MSNFYFLNSYILPSEGEANNPAYSNYKHQFFPLSKTDIDETERVIKIPLELKIFYKSIGYGFLHCNQNQAFNRILDVGSFKNINLKEDYYEFDTHLEVYDFLYSNEKLLFFEVIEGNYLAIDKKDTNGRNPIYYFETKIADSLEEFLKKFDENYDMLSQIENGW